VTVTRRNRRKKGFISGIRDEEGQKILEVKIAREGNLTQLITVDQALHVEVSDRELKRLPKVQRGRVVIDRPRFVEAFLKLERGIQIDARSKLEVLLVGQVNRLQWEICETQLAVQSKDKKGFIEGHLQDILCVRQFAGSGPYKSDIHAARTRVEGMDIPAFAVFAGARGYLEWRNEWKDAHWIVVLDKTSNQFEDATSLFNQDVYKYGLAEAKLDELPAIPSGVEASILCEERAR
ncbi:MAG: hypothetical protein ACRERD_06785, partial [Candidatus Binatia bacterium]